MAVENESYFDGLWGRMAARLWAILTFLCVKKPERADVKRSKNSKGPTTTKSLGSKLYNSSNYNVFIYNDFELDIANWKNTRHVNIFFTNEC